jgi:hypothetical protein
MQNHARGVVALGALALALVAAVPVSASASTWKVTEVPDGSVGGILWAVSCPSPSLCVATGTNSAIISSTNPTGGPSAWNAVHPEGYWLPPGGLPPGATASYPGNAIRGVSCPTTGFCAAAGPQGHFFTTTDPTGPAEAWTEAKLGLDATHMNGISCPTPSFCAAVGQNGRVVTSTNPTGGVAAWTITKLNEPFDLRGVSCPTPSLCVAVALDGNILSSTDPTGGAGAWAVARQPAGARALNGVSCPTASLCVTGNSSQMLSSTSPAGGASAWKAVTAGSGLEVSAASCPSASACAAVTDNADVITSTDPTGGPTAWSFRNVIPSWLLPTGKENPNGDTNAMWGISCPTADFCMAAGQERKVITSTDPFAADPVKKGESNGKKGRRPHVEITHHPGKRVDQRRGGARVTFRFRSIGKAARFKCRINKRKLQTCASPKRYRLAGGNFHFKVYAVGPTGIKGPPARYRFRVGPILEPGPTPTCPPGQEDPGINGPGGRGCQEPPTRPGAVAGASLSPVVPSQTLVITHPTPGGGVITSDPPGLNCETFFCGADFRQGTPVTVIATPRKGFAFAGFTDACKGPVCSLTMDGEKRVTVSFVRFAEQSYKKVRRIRATGTAIVTIRAAGPGTLVLSGKQVKRRVETFSAASNVQLEVAARGDAAKRLRRSGDATVDIAVTFTPSDGIPATLTRPVRLHLNLAQFEI